MKKGKGNKATVRRVIAGVVFLMAAVLGLLITELQLLPMRYLLAVYGILLVPVLVIALMTRDYGRRGVFGTGLALAVIYIGAAAFGCVAVARTSHTLHAIMAPAASYISASAAQDDPAYMAALLSAPAQTSEPFVMPTTAPDPEPTPEPAAEPTAEPTAEPAAEPTPEPDPWDGFGEAFTVYLSGIDSREGLITYSRTDANVLATVNRATHQILLVSIPRDLYVVLPNSDGVKDKLTHSGMFGVEVSKETVEMLFDMEIDYYFRSDFGGVKKLIDAMGGVTVNSELAFSTSFEPYFHFDQGENTLNGEQALSFARERKSLPNGDGQRGRDQMILLEGVSKKLMSLDILNSYTDILEAMEECFDTSIPYELFASLVRQQLDEGGEWEIIMYSIDFRSDMQYTYSFPSEKLYVGQPVEESVETAKDLMARMHAGEVLTDPSQMQG